MHQHLFRRFSAALCAGLFALTLLIPQVSAQTAAGNYHHNLSGATAAGNYRHNLSGATALSSVPDGIIMPNGIIIND